MPLYCLNCNKELGRIVDMQGHVVNCWRKLRKTGKFTKDDWKKAQSSPKFLSERYFTAVDPTAVELRYPKARDVVWDALFHEGVRARVDAELTATLMNEVKLADFDWRNFRARLDISGTVADERVYYRKMSQAEFDACKDKPNKFKATFDYTNTPLYRYWMSSSLAKVQAFGNENASEAGFIVKIVFKESPLKKFTIKAHQAPGVQGDSSVVALHREGFAELGSFNSDADVAEITNVAPKLDFNLGFTASHAVAMQGLLDSYARL